MKATIHPDPRESFNAGDAFLFESRVFHTSALNLSQRTSKGDFGE
jgi:hypothetical protein